ncbi:hypothetical protein D6C84_06068 [Aureobasidium pullulans]|uniref:BTB domain-containing protein n=1 Tax=Aureobasidium pullulans TaxID=5580 RepID=A0A4S9XQ98_AURPU|nr:hypothetical protein D6C84_06068 [Aureobasidium pullulans]
MSVWSSLTGPFCEITVGSGDAAVVFSLPKVLLCNSSTYFKAALNNGFSETSLQKINLDDDDPHIFRTYAAWLFEHEIANEAISNNSWTSDDFWNITGFEEYSKAILVDLLKRESMYKEDFSAYSACMQSICRYHLHNHQSEERKCIDSVAKELNMSWTSMGDLEQVEWRTSAMTNIPGIHFFTVHKDADEEKACVKKVEAGRNVDEFHEGNLKQVEWKW